MGQAATASASATSVVEAASADVLDEVRAPGCAAAIWQRSLAPQVRTWLDALPGQDLPVLRAALKPDGVGPAVDRACAQAGLAAGEGPALFRADVEDLARRFARLMRTDALHLRLDAVSGNACSRFHLDYVPARLLCTYRGAGTEYGTAGPGGQPTEVQNMQPGWVGLFRGRLWPGTERCDLLHRSPPIEGRGETRLLLVIDIAETDDR